MSLPLLRFQAQGSGRREGEVRRQVQPETSALIAAVSSWHEHHERTRSEIARRGRSDEQLVLAGHPLAETYSVLTRPASPASPAVGRRHRSHRGELAQDPNRAPDRIRDVACAARSKAARVDRRADVRRAYRHRRPEGEGIDDNHVERAQLRPLRAEYRRGCPTVTRSRMRTVSVRARSSRCGAVPARPRMARPPGSPLPDPRRRAAVPPRRSGPWRPAPPRTPRAWTDRPPS